jgi:peptide deformylase
MNVVTLDDADHRVLREPAAQVHFPLDPEIKTFVQEFWDFFATQDTPAGLAAPQVGVGLQIIIFQVPEIALAWRKDIYDIIPPTLWINPRYTPIEKDGMTKDWEGCFSVPDLMGEVPRYNSIHYQAFSESGEAVEGIARGFHARVLQHEIGHLNGEVYTDLINQDCRLGPVEEMRVLRQQELGLK